LSSWLSIDIDLNYIGALNREKILNEKPVVIDAIHQILLQNQFERHRSPMHHAGGKMVWFYPSVLGQRGSLEIDLNFIYRQPLYPIVSRPPNIENQMHWQTPVLDIHELAAGKLSALLNRTASRDLFDAHHLMTKINLDIKKLREVLVVYLAMTKIDLASLLPEAIEYQVTDVKNRLLPVMHQQSQLRTLPQLKTWATTMLAELRQALTSLLPLKDNEVAFIQEVRTKHTISPKLITDNKTLAEKIAQHPAIHWAMKQWNE